MNNINFGARFEIYGKPQDVKTAYNLIKLEATRSGENVAFIDTSNPKNRSRLDRVVITGKEDVDTFHSALKSKKVAEEFLESKQDIIRNTKAKKTWKKFYELNKDWNNFDLPGHTKKIFDPLNNICLKATDTINALKEGNFNIESGKIKN